MNDIYTQIRTIAPALFNGTSVLFAYMYGSHAQGITHPFSDLDIGVFVEGLTPKQGLDLELSLSLRLDKLLNHAGSSEVRILNNLPLTVTGNILTSSKLIYSRDENTRIKFETQTRLAYFDFLPVIRQYQNHYRKRAIYEASNGVH